jgi:hypothetical protein
MGVRKRPYACPRAAPVSRVHADSGTKSQLNPSAGSPSDVTAQDLAIRKPQAPSMLDMDTLPRPLSDAEQSFACGPDL